MESDKTLLIVDDDAPLRERLSRAMERKGFVVRSAGSVAEGLAAVKAEPPAYAVIDMRLEDGYGLTLVEAFHAIDPDMRIVILTAYGNIASAVKSVKLGAVDYLAKPADADMIASALTGDNEEWQIPEGEVMTPGRVRWEHIQRVFEQCERNVSETARRLKMHRRTLQRILGKHAPRED
jgi:two-component system response regulator RegA